MILKRYNVSELEGLVKSGFFDKYQIIPITSHRAAGQILNPRAEKSDIILIVAFDEDIISGYIGILPDKIFSGGKEIKAGWISCWWTDKEKGKMVALELFQNAMEAWSNRIIITDMIPMTRFIVERTGEFFFPKTYEGIRGFARFNMASVLPARSAFFRNIRFVLKPADFFCNIIFDILLKGKLKVIKEEFKRLNVEVEETGEIDLASEEIIKICNQGELIRRGSKELSWIKNHPWVSDSEEAKNEGYKYFFSSYCKAFEIKFIRIKINNDLKGFLMISIRDGHFRIPYAYFMEKESNVIMKVLCQLLITRNSSMLSTFHPYLVQQIKNNKSPFFYKRKIFKDLAVSNVFRDIEIKGLLQDGDGDCAFT